MKKIEFSKYHGQGNDFVIIDASDRKIQLSGEQIMYICDRHFGVGADGLILVKNAEDEDFYMDYYNMDGTRAEMCGNGIRCMAGFIFERALSDKKSLNIGTLAGAKSIEMDISGKIIGNISVDMGRPVFDPSLIPVNVDRDEVFNYKISIGNKVFGINCVSMGNPHCVIFISETDRLEDLPLDVWGPAVEDHDLFPNKTNVEFVKLKDENHIEMRVWERGVGETLACGTGACAAGVCAIKLGRIKNPEVDVMVPGGSLGIIWDKALGNVFLKGRVQHVFDGIYYLA